MPCKLYASPYAWMLLLPRWIAWMPRYLDAWMPGGFYANPYAWMLHDLCFSWLQHIHTASLDTNCLTLLADPGHLPVDGEGLGVAGGGRLARQVALLVGAVLVLVLVLVTPGDASRLQTRFGHLGQPRARPDMDEALLLLNSLLLHFLHWLPLCC